MSSTGTAALTVESGRDLKNVEFFGKQDPYAVVVVGDQSFKTEVAKNGGSNPVWNQTFEIPATGNEDVSIVVMDDEMLNDEMIGRATLSLANAKNMGQDRQDVPLFTKDGREAGYISVTAKFATPMGGGYNQGGYNGGYAEGGRAEGGQYEGGEEHHHHHKHHHHHHECDN